MAELSLPSTARVAVHLTPTPLVTDSRVFRMAEIAADAVDHVVLLGISGPDLAAVQSRGQRQTVVRVPRPHLRPRGFRDRVINTVAWSVSANRALASLRIDTVSAHSLAMLPLACWVKWRKRCRLIYEPHELETETIVSTGFRQRLERVIERVLIRHADVVITVGESIGEWYQRTYRLPGVVTFRNAPSRARLPLERPSFRHALGITEDAEVFIYQGALEPHRRVEQYIRVFSKLGAEYQLVIMGSGSLAGQLAAATAALPNVHLIPSVPPEEVVATASGADVGLCGVEGADRSLSHTYCLPNKLFEYIQAGVAVLSNDLPEIRRVVSEHQCGWTLPDRDPSDEAYTAFIRTLTRDAIGKAKSAARRASEAICFEAERPKVDRVYSALMAGRPEEGVRPYAVCARCVMDTTDPTISFDAEGVCSHCHAYAARARTELLPPDEAERALAALAKEIAEAGRGKKYDCVIGVSGGVDSTMVAYLVKQLGLRPLAVHLDNGWDAELAVHNIERCVKKLEIDLVTHVVDWEEFRQLQLGMLRASIANIELVTDHAIGALLFKTAARHGVRYVISGGNLATEAIMPREWMYDSRDLRLILGVNRRFGGVRPRTYPSCSLVAYAYHLLLRRTRYVSILNYIQYDRTATKALLGRELGWRDYTGKHHESIFTRFFQSYILPAKFRIDKRRAHLSTLILSGQVSRAEAIAELAEPQCPEAILDEDRRLFLKKMRISADEFDAIMRAPVRTYRDYPSNAWLFARYSSRFFDLVKAIVRPQALKGFMGRTRGASQAGLAR